MNGTDDRPADSLNNTTHEDEWPGIDSRFRLIVLAALRSKQLQRGAAARIEPDSLRRRNTSIALAEVKQGLVSFTTTKKDDGDDSSRASQGAPE